MNLIVDHPAYTDMPCTRDEAGKIDWSIPSNRKEGSKNWNGNARRREWWREQARAREIALVGNWLSTTAKRIHPLQKKPCQTCGRWMDLRYVYPNATLLRYLNSKLSEDAQLAELDFMDIFEVVDHLVEQLGFNEARAALGKKFPAVALGSSSKEIKEILEDKIVPTEPRVLSPGAMSNAPDRLDGFHSYNKCCRGRQDTGRSTTKLRSYTVDRRAFEQWCEGDWSAANFLMGQVGFGTCATCGREARLSADHIGPISLGFAHSPHFAAVCVSCNSGKNNRMRLVDVQRLLALEESVEGSETLVSWQAKALWNRCKGDVRSDEDALLLSRLLRANQHLFLTVLAEIAARGMPDLLIPLLDPGRAGERVEFVGLDPATLDYERIERSPRQETYARSQGARMVRIAFDALGDYATRGRRNVRRIDDPRVDMARLRLEAALVRAEEEGGAWREDLADILVLDADSRDLYLAGLFEESYAPPDDFSTVHEELHAFFGTVAEVLSEQFHAGTAEAVADALLGDEAELNH